MPTIRISDDTARAINELGGTFDKPDDVLQRIIREAGHGDLLTQQKTDSDTMTETTRTEGTRLDWIESWKDKLEQEIASREVSFHRFSGQGGADFEIGDNCVGKVRTSKAWNRNDRIWLRFDDEIKWAKNKPGQETVAVVLDLYDGSPSFTEQDHFFVLDREMLLNDTSDAGNRELDVYDPGQYESPFDRYADDWHAWY